MAFVGTALAGPRVLVTQTTNSRLDVVFYLVAPLRKARVCFAPIGRLLETGVTVAREAAGRLRWRCDVQVKAIVMDVAPYPGCRAGMCFFVGIGL